MFSQSKVVYIINKNAGKPSNIINDLIQKEIYEYFFESEDFINDSSFINFIMSLPQNTVFCFDLNFNKNSNSNNNKSQIAIPFISSHISFPVKLGEVVWFYKHNLEDNNLLSKSPYNIDGYYLGRAHSLKNTEDVSYCFSEREFLEYNKNNFSNLDNISNIVNNSDPGILDILSLSSEYFTDSANIIYNPNIQSNVNIAQRILNKDYYFDTLSKYKLKTSNNIRTKPEDITLQGSHNTLLNLTSENNNLDSEDQSSGKIELTSGYNERLKNENNSETEILDSITLEKYVDRESHHINLYNNLSPEVFNGVFYERIKNQSQFLNREILSSNIIKNINLFEDNSLLSHKSSFVISEQNLEGYLLNKKINFSIPFIKSQNKLNPKTTNSNLYDQKRKFSTFLPQEENIEKYIFSNKLSSITSISDDVTFSLHDNSNRKGKISLISPTTSSYITLTNSGNIHINSNQIVIGDANRENSKLYLGYSSDMQSLVLGEQLNEFIKELLMVQKETLDLTKDLFRQSKDLDNLIIDSLKQIGNAINNFSTSFSTSLSVAPLTFLKSSSDILKLDISNFNSNVNSINVKKYEDKIKNFKANKEENLYKRLDTIEKNLDKLLSKFVKTS
jgi:hypothetical protein